MKFSATLNGNALREIEVPENKLLRNWIRRVARSIVRRAGVRKNINDYYHPPEFKGKYERYREYFKYCLFLEREKLLRAQQGRMDREELEGLVNNYVAAGNWRERQLVLETARARGGRKGVEALARELRMDPEEALEALDTLTKQRRSPGGSRGRWPSSLRRSRAAGGG
ncbi:hypothetical protein [Ammonifex thiophilus]|uniref:Uncharacterized protein n=1 Tax=Ammonifex thiophilus TaxID=444093 RepID=A0A3D8P424_9THEO|nr:hypothetical protein [Ammonifex thiophilus]RDV83902.1 hypothetical protein DXX99_03445 [Ammonifex thiophilus]